MNLEELRIGASVMSSEGHKLGSLSRFVVNRDSLVLTHIVIDTGILRSGTPLWEGGWGLSHDRIVPLGALDSATGNELTLTMSADEFRDLSVDFAQEGFLPYEAADAEPGRLDVSDVGRLLRSIPGEPGPYFMYDVEAKAHDEFDIGKDSPVWRLKPHEKLGEVERVIFDEDSRKVTAIVVKRGFVFTKEVVMPVEYVCEVVGDIVRVEIDDDTLRALPEFEPQD